MIPGRLYKPKLLPRVAGETNDIVILEFESKRWKYFSSADENLPIFLFLKTIETTQIDLYDKPGKAAMFLFENSLWISHPEDENYEEVILE
jgi:hypothetical protein